MRSVLSLILIVLLALTLAACGTANKKKESDGILTPEDLTEKSVFGDGGTLRVALVYDDPIFQKTLALFKSRYPAWTVEIVPCSEIKREGNNTTLVPLDIDKARLLRVGEADLINLNPVEALTLRDENLLEDLLLLFQKDDETNIDKLLSSLQKALDMGGGLYCLPVSFTTEVLYLNSSYTVTREENPPDHWTWDEMAEWFEPDRERQEAEPLIAESAEMLTQILLSQNYSYFAEPEKDRYDFESPVFKEILLTVKSLQEKGLLGDPEADYAKTFDKTMLWGMVYGDNVKDFKNFKTRYGQAYPLPVIAGTDGIAAEFNSCFGISVNAGKTEQMAAWEFIKILLSDEIQNGGLHWGGSSPVIRELTKEGIQTYSGGGLPVNGIISSDPSNITDEMAADYNRERQAYYDNVNRIALYGGQLDDISAMVIKSALLFYKEEISYEDCLAHIQTEVTEYLTK